MTSNWNQILLFARYQKHSQYSVTACRVWGHTNSACCGRKGSPPSSSDNRLRSVLCAWRSASFTDWEAAISKFNHSLAKSSLWRTPTSNCPKLSNCSKVQIVVFLGRPTIEHPQSCMKEGWQQSTDWNKDTEHSALMSRQLWAQRGLTDCVRSCQQLRWQHREQMLKR